MGYLASVVESFWGLGGPFGTQEQVWLLVTWAGGQRERIEEDYPPWTSVEELQPHLANGGRFRYRIHGSMAGWP